MLFGNECALTTRAGIRSVESGIRSAESDAVSRRPRISSSLRTTDAKGELLPEDDVLADIKQ